MKENDLPEVFRPFHYNLHVDYLLASARYNYDFFIKEVNSRNDPSMMNKELFGSFNTVMLLLGLALENTIKARIYCKEREYILEKGILTLKVFMTEKKWNRRRISHSLLGLLENHGIEVTDKERAMFSNFQDYAIWAGRFPFDLHTKDIEGQMKAALGPEVISEVEEFVADQRDQMLSAW